MDGGRKPASTTAVEALALVLAVGAAAVAATAGDSWAVRTIPVLVAGDVAVRLRRR